MLGLVVAYAFKGKVEECARQQVADQERAKGQITRAAGGQELGGDEGCLLASLAAVVTAFLGLLEPDAVPGWFHGNNPHLNGRRPIDVLAVPDRCRMQLNPADSARPYSGQGVSGTEGGRTASRQPGSSGRLAQRLRRARAETRPSFSRDGKRLYFSSNRL